MQNVENKNSETEVSIAMINYLYCTSLDSTTRAFQYKPLADVPSTNLFSIR